MHSNFEAGSHRRVIAHFERRRRMRMKWILLALLLTATQSVHAADIKPSSGEHDHAAMMRGMGKPTAWTLYPTLKARMSGENRESMSTVIMPQNIVAGSIDAW